MFARQICRNLGIPFYSVNLSDTFKENVVDFFLEEHKKGDTPNPCVRCNKTIKFGAFFNKMQELGCDFLATGHYARLIENKSGEIELHRGKDPSKDQTYFLYNLTQDKLKKILFPLGEFDKTEVRAMAKKFGLKELENKKESQGVCFYPEKTPLPFLKRYLKVGEDAHTGPILDEEGKQLGEHQGLPFYTVGQRKGLNIGGLKEPMFVKKVDRLKNALILGNENSLHSESIKVKEVNFLSGKDPDFTKTYDLRIRSLGRMLKGKIRKVEGEANTYIADFDEPARAVMAGQSLALYDGSQLVGGGIMTWE